MDYQKKYLKYKQKYLELKYQMGGYQTFDEIIAELKQKGKYDEWVAKGSYFGLDPSGLSVMFEYTDMNSNKKLVGQVVKEYKNGQKNTPVFDFIGKVAKPQYTP